jgi:hypothetical protein
MGCVVGFIMMMCHMENFCENIFIYFIFKSFIISYQIF